MLEEGEGIEALNSLQTKTAPRPNRWTRWAALNQHKNKNNASGEIAGQGGLKEVSTANCIGRWYCVAQSMVLMGLRYVWARVTKSP